MKAPILAFLLGAILTMFVGCASPQRGAAYGREQELRRQLAESIPMKDYGYTIKELRFTPDTRRHWLCLPIPVNRRRSTTLHEDRIGSLC